MATKASSQCNLRGFLLWNGNIHSLMIWNIHGSNISELPQCSRFFKKSLLEVYNSQRTRWVCKVSNTLPFLSPHPSLFQMIHIVQTPIYRKYRKSLVLWQYDSIPTWIRPHVPGIIEQKYIILRNNMAAILTTFSWY